MSQSFLLLLILRKMAPLGKRKHKPGNIRRKEKKKREESAKSEENSILRYVKKPENLIIGEVSDVGDEEIMKMFRMI